MQARQERQRSMCLTTSAVAGPVVLQHVLDQIDAPARAVELVAEQHIGRAGGGAEAAMDAVAQDLVRDFGDRSDRQLGGVKAGLHATTTRLAYMRPGLSMPLDRSCPSPAGQARPGRGLRLEHRAPRRARAAGAANQGRVAAAAPTAPRTSCGTARRRRRQREPDEPAGPVVEDLRPASAARSRGHARAPRVGGGRERQSGAGRSSAANGVDVAHRLPERARGRLARAITSAPYDFSSASSACRAVRDRGRDAFEPQRVTRFRLGDAAPRRRRGQMRGARHLAAEPHGQAHRRDGRARRRARMSSVSSVSGARQDLEGDVGHAPPACPTSRP